MNRLVILSFFIGLFGFSATIPIEKNDLKVIKEVMLLIKSDYVKKNISDKKLIDGAINGMVGILNDPYTHYLTPEEYKELNNETSGKFGGVGIVVSLKNNLVTIISPIYDSPAERAGILSGDIIIAVNGIPIKQGELKKALRLLKGNVGTSVKITVFRPDDKREYTFDLTRQIVKDTSLVFAGVIEKRFGYIKLRNFSATTEEDLYNELKKMMKIPIKGLILDLRANPGGLLQAGINVANLFLKKGTILTTRSRDGDENVYLANARKYFHGFPIVILIDRGTASAAEIVAAALHDNKRAILIGEDSFGKGCVQTVYTLTNGSAITLTTAWYYTPSGLCIQNRGLKPDIYVKMNPIQDSGKLSEISKILKKVYKESIKMRHMDKLYHFEPFSYDNQLIRAVETLKEFWYFKQLYGKESNFITD